MCGKKSLSGCGSPIPINALPGFASTPIRGWTAWSVAYHYPGETGAEPEPSTEEIRQALDLIIQLEAALRSLARPPTDLKSTTNA